jgi:hypothetical protein
MVQLNSMDLPCVPFGNLSMLYLTSLPMQSTFEVVEKYGIMLSYGSFGHFLSNSQASWEDKHDDYFLPKLSEISKGDLHFERPEELRTPRIDSYVSHPQSNSEITDCRHPLQNILIRTQSAPH